MSALSLLLIGSPAVAQTFAAGSGLPPTPSIVGPAVALQGSVAPALRTSRRLDRVAGSRELSVNVTLSVGDSAALDQFLAAVYDPSSPQYGHFLTTSQFAQRFGPSATTVATVSRWLRSEG